MDGILSHSLGNYSSIAINTADINYNKFWIYASAHSVDGVLANDVIEVVNPCYQKPAHTGFHDQAAEIFNIAPNPVTDRLNINFLAEAGRSRYLIADARGQVVMDGILSGSHPNNPQIFPVQFPPGFYSLHIWTDSGIAAQKFIVQ